MTCFSASRLRRDDGFTLVEVLTVSIVIGILAAIALPRFLDQQDKARDADAKLAARDAAGALEAYVVEHDRYDATKAEIEDLAPELGAASWTLSGDVDSYVLRVTSRSGTGFEIRRADRGTPLEHSCGPADRGGCPPGGSW